MADTPVNVHVEIDYEKLAEAITRAMRPQAVTQTVTVDIGPEGDVVGAVRRALSDWKWQAGRE